MLAMKKMEMGKRREGREGILTLSALANLRALESSDVLNLIWKTEEMYGVLYDEHFVWCQNHLLHHDYGSEANDFSWVDSYSWTYFDFCVTADCYMKSVLMLKGWTNQSCQCLYSMATRTVTQQQQRSNGSTSPQASRVCQFKLVLLGESAVGKSSLVLRFVKGQFHEYQESTIGGK